MGEAKVDRASVLRRAAQVIPSGASSGGRAAFEDVIVRAAGAYLWNADGKRLIDYLLAFGPIVIGHCDRRVNEAVMKAVSTCDLNWVGPQAGEVELAETIRALVPSADQVGFCTSGTDATLHAVHVTRAATGRTRLLKFHGSYHGWHDHLAVGSRFSHGEEHRRTNIPAAAGLHPACVADVTVVEWNDLEGIRTAFTDHGSELAAVFCEPYIHSYGCVPAAPGFLEALRELCTRHGTVLVFDEIKTGFRHDLGGYQAVCGVTPDLTTMGKSLGNGYTIAGIAGRAAVMESLGYGSDVKANIDGTYNASPYAVAAARATIEILRDGGIERLYGLGERMRAGLRQAVATAGIDACVTGWGSGWMIYFRSEPPQNYRQVLESDAAKAMVFRKAMFDAGVLEPPFPLADRRLCLATSNDDIDHTIEAAVGAFQQAARGDQ